MAVAPLPSERPVGETAACALTDVQDDLKEEIFTAQSLNFQVSVRWPWEALLLLSANISECNDQLLLVKLPLRPQVS